MKHFIKIQLALCFLLYASTSSANNIAYAPDENVAKIPYPSSLSVTDRDAITRVTLAEANTQGEDGLAGVVFVILNRLKHGGFGKDITEVLNAPRQFEPVSTAGGAWSNLPKPSKHQSIKINTILNLALSGHFPDPTKGSLYFQNAEIVAKREEKGTVSKGLTHFGGVAPSVVIKDHSFYTHIKNGHRLKAKLNVTKSENWDVFQNPLYQMADKNIRIWAE